jgi:release factor glutamine methyltransferase
MHRSLVSCTNFTQRQLSRASSTASSEGLLQRLRENRELDADDAQNELRWMKQSLSMYVDGKQLAPLVERRAKGEPLQYILGEDRLLDYRLMKGSTDFGPLTLKCRAPTLIPRPETADVFGRLATLLRTCRKTDARPLSIIDLCTGSAPIPLLLRHELGDQARVKGYDFSQAAIQLARENIAFTGIDIQVEQADILHANFADTVKSHMDGRVDHIVSNPPYIPMAEYRELPASVREWEDPAALLGDLPGGESGLLFYERIAELLPTLLSSKDEMEAAGWTGIPRVAIEIGSSQGKDVMSMLRGGGMDLTEIWQDQFGKDRMVVGWD